MFQTVSLFIISSFSLYTQQWYVVYVLQLASRIRMELVWFRPDPASCQQTCMTYTIAG